MSHAVSSWPSLTANAIVGLFFLVTHDYWGKACATLTSMNNPFILIGAGFIALSLYGVLYKGVAAFFTFIMNRLHDSKLQKEKLHALLSLSLKQISVLNFLLSQEKHTAWLPNEYLPVLLLERENILFNLDFLNTRLVEVWQGHTRSVSCNAYKIPDDVLILIHSLPVDVHNNWSNIPPDQSLQQYQ